MKRTLALLAALLVAAVPTMAIFTSCGDDEVKTPVDETPNTDVSGEVEVDDGEEKSGVPAEVRFDGEKFSLLIGSSGQQIYAEEETGDIVNDIVYQRNAAVAERFGIEMNIVKSGVSSDNAGQREGTQQIQTLIMSNDDTYQAFTHIQHTGMPELILQKNFVDWNTLPYIDISKPWWYQNITKDLCFGDKVYVMTGDYAMYIGLIDCLVFNKDIFDELELEYPYQDVLDGTWTYDKFAELVMKGAKDLDGDGIQEWDTDRYGLVGWTWEMSDALAMGLGYKNVEKDADNMPVLNQNTDLATDIFDKVIDLFAGKKYAKAEMSDWAGQVNAFNEGRAMFKDLFLDEVVGLRDVEFDFGIIPFPKYDEKSEYISRSSNMVGMTYIPVTNTKLEMTAAVLEEMAYRSYMELTPAYFDIVLTVKNTRDDESAGMLPIIRDSARCMYSDFYMDLCTMVDTGNNTYASDFAANRDAWLETIEEMREMLTEEE